MANELSTIEGWLYERLTGDATLVATATGGIHNTQPPQGSDPPYVVFAFVGGAYLSTIGGTVPPTRADYDVAAYTLGGSFASADAMVERIKAVLHVSTPIAITGGKLNSLMTNPLGSLPNPLGGPRVNRRGVTFRITFEPS